MWCKKREERGKVMKGEMEREEIAMVPDHNLAISANVIIKLPFVNQVTSPQYKTVLCQQFMEGNGCQFGEGCSFAHGHGEVKH